MEKQYFELMTPENFKIERLREINQRIDRINKRKAEQLIEDKKKAFNNYTIDMN